MAFLVFLTFHLTLAAALATTKCPLHCTCTCTGDGPCTSLTVDCGHQNIDREKFTQQLDSLLSSNQTYGDLRSLTIVYTPLTHVPRSICRLQTLTLLNLDNNQLTRLPDNCFSNLTARKSFSASRNSITQLQDGLFDGLHNLVKINASWNRISSIGLRVFNSSSMLTSLTLVDLGTNKLTSLEPWPYFVGVNGNRQQHATVNFKNNSISVFTNTMEFKPNCGMKPTYLDLHLETNSIVRISDILNGWNTSLTAFICLIRFWRRSPSVHIFLYYNYLTCDCIDFDIYKYASAYRRMEIGDVRQTDTLGKTYCGKPDSLYGKRVYSVPLDEFVCELTDRCPSSCRCVYRPANATLHVYCSNTNITTLPLKLPELPKSYTKYKLEFSSNRLLRRLEHRHY